MNKNIGEKDFLQKLREMSTMSFNELAARPSRVKRGRRKKRGKKREFRRWTWDSYDVNNNMMNNEKIFIGASDFSDYIQSQLFDARFKENKITMTRDYQFHCTRKKWIDYIEYEFDGDYIIQPTNTNGTIICEGYNFIRYHLGSNSVEVSIYGDNDFIESAKDSLFASFDEVTSHIEWVYSSDGNSVNVPLNKDRLPVAEMYSFLNGETLENYYERFLNSQANILLLIGPPGTGKTTFIRGLLAYSNSSAIVTYDAAILERDNLFARFIEDDANIMVLEDSDNFLKARSDGNTMMHRFLNVGDGLVTTKGKKLIFSTNLPSIRDVDSALIRPGRCFDILNFDNLTHNQAEKLAEKINVELDGVREKWTIAEIFNKQIENSVAKKIGTKMGFV
jgi:hypothetical protein